MSTPDPKQIPHTNMDEPIELAPDQDDDNQMVFKPARLWSDDPLRAANQETAADSTETSALSDPASAMPARKNGRHTIDPLSDSLRWALDALHHPAMAAADWLARDIDPAQPTATSLLTNPSITITQVRQAKSVFKTMRIVGEKSADRRVGARMYAAAIAAGIVRHGRKISTQSDSALKRAFQALLDDRRMPQPLRDLAGLALCTMVDKAKGLNDEHDLRSKSA